MHPLTIAYLTRLLMQTKANSPPALTLVEMPRAVIHFPITTLNHSSSNRLQLKNLNSSQTQAFWAGCRSQVRMCTAPCLTGFKTRWCTPTSLGSSPMGQPWTTAACSSSNPSLANSHNSNSNNTKHTLSQCTTSSSSSSNTSNSNNLPSSSSFRASHPSICSAEAPQIPHSSSISSSLLLRTRPSLHPLTCFDEDVIVN
jgi:hypothetical protein